LRFTLGFFIATPVKSDVLSWTYVSSAGVKDTRPGGRDSIFLPPCVTRVMLCVRNLPLAATRHFR